MILRLMEVKTSSNEAIVSIRRHGLSEPITCPCLPAYILHPTLVMQCVELKWGGENAFVLALVLSMVVVFILLPLGLPAVGVSQLDSLAIAILGAGILANTFLTKHGFNIHGYENNLVYSYARKFLTPNRFIIVAGAIEAVIGLALFAIISDQYIVLLIALYALSGVILHSVDLATRQPNESLKTDP